MEWFVARPIEPTLDEHLGACDLQGNVEHAITKALHFRLPHAQFGKFFGQLRQEDRMFLRKAIEQSLRWRAANDKGGREWTVPVSAPVETELRLERERRAGEPAEGVPRGEVVR